MHVDAVTRMGQGVLITARIPDNDSACQSRTIPSCRVHSRYRRLLTDVTCGDVPVTIDLRTRRFFCGNRSCSTRTFAEQVPALAQRHARRTVALSTLLEPRPGWAGRAGARLAARLGITVFRSLLIRLLRALPDPAMGQIRVLGPMRTSGLQIG
ncbi:hypothetical protein [Nonomuraea lactucae]|uniref:hypothetical protein n=1 Tax=Nonomuraea lactucae TaxID=2249762 RepID=UPI000DE52FD9|nr:hypothetical protein [Nonomuraea lactucae]